MLTVGCFLLKKKIKKKAKTNIRKESTGIEDSNSEGILHSNNINLSSSIVNNPKLSSKIYLFILNLLLFF